MRHFVQSKYGVARRIYPETFEVRVEEVLSQAFEVRVSFFQQLSRCMSKPSRNPVEVSVATDHKPFEVRAETVQKPFEVRVGFVHKPSTFTHTFRTDRDL